MRQLAHKAVGLFFWIVLITLWVVLVRENKAGTDNFVYSAQYVGAIAAAVLAITLLWIQHNMAIYRRKGARRETAVMLPRTDEDRLGRPICWELEGGAVAALDAGHVVVELDGGAKVYRRVA